MNNTIRTVFVFVALVAAVLVASTVYRRGASTPAATDPAAVQQPTPVDESTLHPSMRNGLAAASEGREDEAIAHFQAVPADSPDYPAALLRVAVSLARRGDVEQARDSLLQLTQLHPDNPEVLAALGWMFYLAGDYDGAERAGLRTLELEPGHLSTRYNIALYRVAQGRTQAAVRSYLRALREDPAGREIPLHRERLQAFHDEHPDQPAAHYALAFLANSTQDRRSEIEELEHFLALVPEGAEADGARQRINEAKEALGSS